MTLAGYVSAEDRWARFSKEWASILQKFNLREFKTADWYNAEGEFRDWPSEKRYRLFHALARVLDNRVRFAVSVSVPVLEHDRLAKPKVPAGSPFEDTYVFGMQACVEIIVTAPLRRRERVEFVFDEGHRRQGRASTRFVEMITSRQLTESVVPTFGRTSSLRCPPLQAADALAWATRKHLDDLARNPRARARPELIRLRRKLPILGGRLDITRMMHDVDAKVLRMIREGAIADSGNS